jgi:hypothetical protein
MKKTIVNVLVLFVVIVSIFTFINMVSVDRAEAVSCPEGLVCTPVQSGASVCPVGYTCTPAPTCPIGYTCKPIEIQPTTCPSGYICKLTNNGGGSSGGSGGGGLSNRCYRFETNLSVGGFWTKRSTGADVVALQTILMEKGFDIPSISSKGVAKGVFGTETKSALMRYQASVGIPATGVADPQTRSVLNSLCSSTNNPSIKVLSPRGGEVYKGGDQMTVRWQTDNTISDGSNIWIHLDTPDGKHLNNGDLVNNHIPNTGEKTVVISPSIPAGRYKVVVTVGQEFEDTSDGYITITSSTPAPTPSYPQSITIVSPNGGESYAQGSKVKVKWSTVNIPASANLDVFSLNNESTGTSYDLTYNVPNVPDSAFAIVTIPNYVPVGKYKLEINALVNGRMVIDSSDYSFVVVSPVSSTPAPTPSYSPSINVLSPNSGEVWRVGDKKTITWSYANWNSGIFGNKYVDMYLVPMDGRSPMKLATNFNSPDGTVPVTIYEKTSDGRSAWLPGRYKIRVVCNTANVAPFNSCMDESDGYITVVSNPPSPTPIPNSTSMIDQDVLNASIWDAIKQYFDSKAIE